ESLHTPGHALHHQAFADIDANAVFAGDTFGVSYRAFNRDDRVFIVPTTTPTQFDPEQLKASIARLAALRPQSVYLTHFGRVTGADVLAASLCRQIDAFVALARRYADASDRSARIAAELLALWQRLLAEQNLRSDADLVADVLGFDAKLNADGLVAWLERTTAQRQ
ncbi:MAG: hypothetical protein NZM12_10205, partial [Steroidobacteraceae bacterium]|nr:hypothetical protein [Steroidobacteraceae bacterium]MDW8259704.1 MBL fold metallo-hydrolase [Gammaproteobacteria bacterium]